MEKYILAPSILGANFIDLRKELDDTINAGTNWIHYDVMDNHFVPNLTFGPKVLADIKKAFPKLNVDIHFMVDIEGSMDEYFKPYLECKPKSMTMHIESLKKKRRIMDFITYCEINEVACMLAISPETKVVDLIPYLPHVDGVLVMTVRPGFGGQSFMPECVDKIKFLDGYKKDNNLEYIIEVDGGINAQTGAVCKLAGANMFVAGSYFYNAPANIKKEIVSDFTNEK
ncbi:ribulose-phosphate 3-epimerase [Mesoplasma lactucae]|uniref:Ribulose-phosphate 3-epimerase n=1 Tax=Mesoplasma lactucae ATCC 49193 TaxID=81460 RepID=A0A291IS71_9MOLU|nr:ribulose-phosphate 3-epimerase [Mesoplasma lactucae]ATG97537.1 ribulose-phosphate 3-epimerase [Mesoplasma lactucae ATCC 49193]ATZ20005.1 ribulose-phosphate 3-epimerase [Mesoplasma lactucae ATCC 49193]MCL8217044.1 Ribulose-phosphate 3-epimerase [Mesoplasma lactucae ATCC 49193]